MPAAGPARSDYLAEVLDDLQPGANGLRHPIRQNEYARSNRHNVAVIRGTAPVQRLLELTGVEEQLVLVDDPDDLAPPPWTS